MARALKLPATVAIARDIVEQGNTSAASIPLAMERMLDDGNRAQRRRRPADRLRSRSGVRRTGRRAPLDRLSPQH
ncbi:MAG: 3-oxoacyl-[acyl-carrier-protein] synthase III C-terminal domain-containing protein [Nocardioidaceae bacterium]